METKLASFVKVPIVQELAREKLATVPPRYHYRPDNDHLILSDPSSFPEIPVINMTSCIKLPKNGASFSLLSIIRRCYFYLLLLLQLINHGVESEVIETMKTEIQEFFHMSMEEKNKFKQEAGDVEGYGQHFVVSDEQKLDWADMFYLVTSPTYSRKPHLLPKLPPTFRDAIEAYSAQVKILAMKILIQMAKALHLKAEEMKTRYSKRPSNQERWSLDSYCDEWCLSEDRATVNAKKERLSIATFHTPTLDCDIGPAPSLVAPETPAKFRRTTVDDYYKGFFSRELYGKSYLGTFRI
ncbi:hypothetical protein BUALT_Bualt03G0052300 [Buddleja alternifolia]|uniref:Non-haem dioxygenase N-terminal domain-containing protein n=1 Tax=Buddleja alternifolia TaxID=168488 RepID=A0AAV6XVL4_9LAMI|nr:hypothetical protein BUALT_Bualt03G0052300 [Buddleja alternifolia]